MNKTNIIKKILLILILCFIVYEVVSLGLTNKNESLMDISLYIFFISLALIIILSLIGLIQRFKFKTRKIQEKLLFEKSEAKKLYSVSFDKFYKSFKIKMFLCNFNYFFSIFLFLIFIISSLICIKELHYSLVLIDIFFIYIVYKELSSYPENITNVIDIKENDCPEIYEIFTKAIEYTSFDDDVSLCYTYSNIIEIINQKNEHIIAIGIFLLITLSSDELFCAIVESLEALKNNNIFHFTKYNEELNKFKNNYRFNSIFRNISNISYNQFESFISDSNTLINYHLNKCTKYNLPIEDYKKDYLSYLCKCEILNLYFSNIVSHINPRKYEDEELPPNFIFIIRDKINIFYNENKEKIKTQIVNRINSDIPFNTLLFEDIKYYDEDINFIDTLSFSTNLQEALLLTNELTTTIYELANYKYYNMRTEYKYYQNLVLEYSKKESLSDYELYELSDAYFKTNEIDKAVEICDILLNKYSDKAFFYLEKSRCLLSLSNKEAFKYFIKANELCKNLDLEECMIYYEFCLHQGYKEELETINNMIIEAKKNILNLIRTPEVVESSFSLEEKDKIISFIISVENNCNIYFFDLKYSEYIVHIVLLVTSISFANKITSSLNQQVYFYLHSNFNENIVFNTDYEPSKILTKLNKIIKPYYVNLHEPSENEEKLENLDNKKC